jgi:hypothetical protein
MSQILAPCAGSISCFILFATEKMGSPSEFMGKEKSTGMNRDINEDLEEAFPITFVAPTAEAAVVRGDASPYPFSSR